MATADTDTYFVITDRLGFRFWTEADLDLARGLWGDPRVTEFIPATGRLSDADIKARLDAEMLCGQTHGIQYWPIFSRETGDHLGCCGLRPYKTQPYILEIGFHIRSAHWRRGYAGEAARATIRHAFANLGVAGLFAGHNPKNAGSRLLLEKLGFTYTHDELYPPTGLMHPSYLLER